LNPAGEQIFFRKSILFAYTFFLKLSFDNTVTWHSKHASERKIEHTSSGNLNMLIAN